MLRLHAKDDRDQPIRLVRFLPGGPKPTWNSPITLALALVVVVVLMGATALHLFGPDVVGLSIFSVVIAPTMAILLTALAKVRNAWRDRSQLLRSSMNSRKLCAACAYDLSNHDPEPDGCTVCPECSAAWRLTTDPDSPAVIVIARDR